MRLLVLLVTLASTTGCLRTTEFKCTIDDDCTATDAVCETTGYCSFVDSECASGRRYGELSGSYANKCVDETATVDAGVDTAPAKCATYATLPNAGTHLYKLTTDAAPWTTQRDRCDADEGYLAIPDNAAELQAIATLGAAARTWIGIDDRTTEGTFVTVLGPAPAFAPWDTANGEPNNNGEQDCVAALMASPLIVTDRCVQTFPAVCECEP